MLLPAGSADGWAMLQAAPEGPGGEVLEGGGSLLGVVAARIRTYLAASSPPLVCGACRAAGAALCLAPFSGLVSLTHSIFWACSEMQHTRCGSAAAVHMTTNAATSWRAQFIYSLSEHPE